MQTDLSVPSLPCFLTYFAVRKQLYTKAGSVSSQLSTWIFVMAQAAKTTYGAGIHTDFSFKVVPKVGRVLLQLFLVKKKKKVSPLCYRWIRPDNKKPRSGETIPPPPEAPAGLAVSYTFRSCRFESAEGSQAEDFPLTGEESLARLSLSLGVKAVTDPNAYTVVAAFQFLITAWLVRLNEGSRVRMINIPIMRTSQAKDHFLFGLNTYPGRCVA